ncbi:S41 family peptidase [Engelhardtia mirabilis]|uniref:PDZ domain-containing protein n=1 Tax=Engelhardtia mirabilis TaxID=2528011 RepID=A0A518BM98_9BACT|nr:hypothetical protein Pla133_31980 [Planctomycetes bacterium Pla133]QDV02430.1 hypothetical protein Pla86_31970 [Planctomycetes bacterium Pla86]
MEPTRTLLGLLLLSPALTAACALPQPAAVVADVEPTVFEPRANARTDVLRAPGLPQFPSIDPTGQWIAFSHAGDLWAVPAAGGVASRLTAHPAREGRSAFAPDGRRLAFESNRDGATNLYVVDLEQQGGRLIAGEPRRVTSTDRSESLGGFTGDGSALLFASSREPGLYRASRMFRVGIDGGPITRLTDAFGSEPHQGADGRVVFRRGRDLYERPRYRGPGAPELWSLDLASGAFEVLAPSDASEHAGFPTPDGGLVFVSSRSGSNQVWRTDAAGRTEALTNFVPAPGEPTIGHGVRDLDVSVDGKHAAFAVWDRIYTLDLGQADAAPRVVAIALSVDDSEADVDVVDLAREVDESAVSPDGATVAVVARGEVLVRATAEDRPTRRITDSVSREADVAWSPDGATLYFVSDESGRKGIYTARVALARQDLEPAEAPESAAEESDDEAAESEAGDTSSDTEVDVDVEGTEPESDATTEDEGDGDEAESDEDDEPEGPTPGERWAQALTFTVEPLVLDPDVHLWHPLPSPDGRSLLYLRERGDMVLMDLASGASRTLLGNWDEPEVEWAADSRHLVYAVSDLDFNGDVWIGDVGPADAVDWTFEPVNVTRHPDIDHEPRLSADGKVLVFLSERAGENFEWDVWRVYLDRSLEGLSQYELAEHFEEAEKAFAKRGAIDEDTEQPEPFELDLDDAWLRARRLTSLPGSESNLGISPGGSKVVFTGSVGEDSGLWSIGADGDEREKVVGGSPGNVRFSPDGKQIAFVEGGQAKRVKADGGKAETFDIDARARFEIAAQQRQKFLEAAGVLEFAFYHPTLKGLDWGALTQRYLTLAQGTRTSDEFNRVGTMLFGELDGSHLGIFGGDAFRAPSQDTGYLGVDIEPVVGGFEVTEVILGGPADREASRIEAGEVIVSMAGRALAPLGSLPERDLYTVLEGTEGAELLLGVRGVDGTVRQLVIEPMSYTAERDLRYEHDVLARRDDVERLSGGRLGYLHIRGMSMRYVRDFERDLYAAAHGKDGLLIDVRDNGGGSTTDILLASLTAPNHAFTVPRGADPASVPTDAYPRDRRLIYGYSRPIAVLINENSFSNAEIFAHSIRTIGRGRLIGTQTFGGVISTGAAQLIDGTVVRRPFRGWYLPDGTDMEHHGALPDVDVPRTPTDEAAGVDAQLEAAVAALLADIDAGK